MSALRDRLAPALAGTAVAAVAVSVLVLLRSAETDGVDALVRAKNAQVAAIADSFNARVESSLQSAAGLGSVPWELTPGSAADQRVLKTYDVDPDAESGFFLVDAAGTVTSGVLLRPGTVGSSFRPSDWSALKAKLAGVPALALPVARSGLTTDLPSYDFLVAIPGSAAGSVRGALVIESAITATSPFQREIRQLADNDPSSAAWFFLDTTGAVVASTLDTGLGDPVENRDYLTAPTGQSDLGSRIVFAADVPALGWRVVFREDHDQFVESLSGPLQNAGLVVVALLFGVGVLFVVLLVRRLRQAREQERRLRELTRSQAEFISVVSHELRTPVAGVHGFLQTTLDHWADLPDAERLATVRRAATNARRLQAMTRDIFDTESIESGRFGYHFEQLDVVAELRTAIDAQTDADPSHPIRFTGPDRGVLVDGDGDRLQQVFGNLLENARKNSPPSESIEVTVDVLDEPRGRIRICVVDHGAGVDPDSAGRIFDKFVRGNDSIVTGTGLGLYIARTIVEAHHGRVWCESEPGRPTRFVLELPVVGIGAELVEGASSR